VEMVLSGSSRFKRTSELSDGEREWIAGFLADKPWFNFYYQCSLDDLARGLDNRSYLIGRKKDGLITAIHFADVSAFTTVGGVCLEDVSAMVEWPGRAELHVTDTQFETVKGLAGARLRRTDRLRYYSLNISGKRARGSRAVEMAKSDHEEVKALFGKFYPETVLSDWLLDLPTAGIREGGRLVAVAGTLALCERMKGCHMGNFLTHPEYRGRGLAGEIAEKLFPIYRARGVATCMLGVFESNTAACRAYERIGFSLVESRPLVYINERVS